MNNGLRPKTPEGTHLRQVVSASATLQIHRRSVTAGLKEKLEYGSMIYPDRDTVAAQNPEGITSGEPETLNPRGRVSYDATQLPRGNLSAIGTSGSSNFPAVKLKT